MLVPSRSVREQLPGVAEAMPESKYSFIPTSGDFRRSPQLRRADQTRRVQPAGCEKGGPIEGNDQGRTDPVPSRLIRVRNRVPASSNEKNQFESGRGALRGNDCRLTSPEITLPAVWWTRGPSRTVRSGDADKPCGPRV
jgi:hypothetical protein